MKKYTRGFTLIELLVVIAIIGILSSVILVSLNSARSKGVATRIQEDAANLRTTFETDYNGSSYPDLVAAANPGADTFASLTTNAATLKTDIITTESGNLKIYDADATVGTVTAYALYVSFPAGGGYCVDSAGNTRTLTSATANTFTAASNFTTCTGGSGAI